MKKTLAIFSPMQNAWSETFIQAHKNLPFNVKFYHDGMIPTKLEGSSNLFDFKLKEKIKIRSNRHFSLSEHALLNSLKREKVDCVLAEYGTTAAETLKVVSFLKLPLIVHFHGADASVKTTLKNYGEQYKNVFKYATFVVVVSLKMKEAIVNLGCPVEKIILTYCAPNKKFFKNNPGFKSYQFLSVGRFVDKKAPYYTLLAFKKVLQDYPDAKLIMVGDGILLNTCRNLVNSWGVDNCVDFVGYKSTDEINKIFENSMAFVQHSIMAENGDSEGTPVAIMEASASALPVISTNHAGIPDIVINEKTGLLVKEHDVNGMANNMRRILAEEGLAKKMGEAGRKRVAELFTMEIHLKVLGEAINNAIELNEKQ